MPKSRTVRAVLAPTLFTLAQVLCFAGYDALRLPTWPAVPNIGADVFTFTGPVLSLLLVFRTDASYTRWDEARQQLGELIFKSRNLLRLGYLALGPAATRDLTVWTVAFGVALKNHLRRAGGPPEEEELTLGVELAKWLSVAELRQLQAVARNKPHYCLMRLSHVVRTASPEQACVLDENIAAFEEVLGRCERINRVPIPLRCAFVSLICCTKEEVALAVLSPAAVD